MIGLDLLCGGSVLVSAARVEAVDGIDGCGIILAGSSTQRLEVTGSADELAEEVGGLVKVMYCWLRPDAVIELHDENMGTMVLLLSGSVHIPGISPAEIAALLEA